MPFYVHFNLLGLQRLSDAQGSGPILKEPNAHPFLQIFPHITNDFSFFSIATCCDHEFPEEDEREPQRQGGKLQRHNVWGPQPHPDLHLEPQPPMAVLLSYLREP